MHATWNNTSPRAGSYSFNTTNFLRSQNYNNITLLFLANTVIRIQDAKYKRGILKGRK
jgi:hypothetical protein